jgi:excisionase family DNA binding protein
MVFDSYTSHPDAVTEPCLPCDAVADVTGYHVQYVRRLCYRGKVDAYRVGRSWLIKIASLIEFMETIEATESGRYGPRGGEASSSDNNT